MGIVLKSVFRNIGHVHGGLCGNKEKLTQQRPFFGAQIKPPNRLSKVKFSLAFLKHGNHASRLFIASACGLNGLGQLFLHAGKIGQCQFGGNGFNVRERVHAPIHMHHVLVFEATHYIHNGIGLANVGQKLVAKPLALACSCNQPGNVNKLHGGGHDALGRDDTRKLIKPGVGQFNNAGVGLDGAKGVVLGRNACLG